MNKISDLNFLLIAVDERNQPHLVKVSQENLKKIINKSFNRLIINPEPIPGLQIVGNFNNNGESKKTIRKNRLERVS
jgi:hypothetical protein